MSLVSDCKLTNSRLMYSTSMFTGRDFSDFMSTLAIPSPVFVYNILFDFQKQNVKYV